MTPAEGEVSGSREQPAGVSFHLQLLVLQDPGGSLMCLDWERLGLKDFNCSGLQ